MEGSWPDRAPLQWGAAAVLVGDAVINSISGFDCSYGDFVRLTADGSATALERPFKLAPDTSPTGWVVLIHRMDPDIFDNVLAITGVGYAMAARTLTEFYFLFRREAFDAGRVLIGQELAARADVLRSAAITCDAMLHPAMRRRAATPNDPPNDPPAGSAPEATGQGVSGARRSRG